jgi:two-component system CheB/CheR fusion protein
VQSVIDTLAPQEARVATNAGVPYLMRIQPYRTLENVIQGAVISFVDISEIKRLKSALMDAGHRLCTQIVATVREPVIIPDNELRVLMANRAFYAGFQVSPEKTIGHRLYDLGNRQ